MPRLRKEGIWFNYYGDNMLWRWPWKRTGPDTMELLPFWSSMHEKPFASIRNYCKFIGALEEITRKYRVRSFDELHLINTWVKVHLPDDNVVVLSNINISAKDSKFWLKLPQHYRPHFLGDYVVLNCGSNNDVYRLCRSIPMVFATAHGFSGGQLVEWNEADEIKDETVSWNEDNIQS